MQLDRSTRCASETVAHAKRLGCSGDPAQPNVRFWPYFAVKEVLNVVKLSGRSRAHSSRSANIPRKSPPPCFEAIESHGTAPVLLWQ